MALRLRLTGPNEQPVNMAESTEPWRRYAQDRAAQGGVDLAWEDPEVVFRIPAP
jgi:hypothetical protein